MGTGNGDEGRRTVLRDEDTLTIIENLIPGPKGFGRDPEGEQEWLHLEPNSGIRLLYVCKNPCENCQSYFIGQY